VDPKCMFASNLGCHNNRVTQLKKLAKVTAANLSQKYAADQAQNAQSVQKKV